MRTLYSTGDNNSIITVNQPKKMDIQRKEKGDEDEIRVIEEEC